MGIPLNIDWQQILLHLFNFAILTAGLYFLLYKPVKKFMDQRTEYYSQMEASAQEKVAEADKLHAERQALLSEVTQELAQKRAESERETQSYIDEQLRIAQEQADKLLSDAQEKARSDRSKLLAEAQEEIAKLASDAVEKLVQQSLDPNSECDRFLEALKEGSANG